MKYMTGSVCEKPKEKKEKKEKKREKLSKKKSKKATPPPKMIPPN